MNILSVDQGTITGWALLTDGEIYSGTQDFTPKRGESPGMRYLRFGGWLHEMNSLAGNGGVGLIVHEMAHHRGGAAAQVAIGLVTKIQEFAAKHACEVTNVHSTRLKKWATGKGNASKQEMIDKCKAMGFNPQSDDEADALLILHYTMDKLGNVRKG